MSLEQAIRLVMLETELATRKHGGFASPHEGKSVIEEELDELWEHVVAAMGLKYAISFFSDANGADLERKLKVKL